MRYMQLAWLWIAVCGIARLFYAQAFLLVPDETNYWQWARHLAWGYHDQAPMIAWAIHLTTAVCGHTELGVRLPSIIATTVASVYLLLIAKHWFGARIAWQTTLIGQSIFLLNVGGLLATSDGLQVAAWAAASYHAALAFQSHQWRHWLLGGFWFGFGLLSKYTMVLLLPCILFYAIFSSTHRRRLASIKPYAACVVGLVMFLPVVGWNAANDWNSVRHVAYIGGGNQDFAIHMNFLGDYLASQAALLTPLVFVLICAGWAWILLRRYRPDQWIFPYLFYTSFPVIAGFAVLSLHTRVYGNWPGAGYATAIVLAAAMWAYRKQASDESSQLGGQPPNKFWIWTVASSYFFTVLILLHVVYPIVPIPVRLDRTADEVKGWDRMGDRVAQIHSTMPRPDKTFLFGLRYQIASELAFYVPGQPMTVSINRWNRPNVYDYWWQDNDLVGQDAVGVIGNSQSRQRLLEVFHRVDPPEPLRVYRDSFWDRKSNRTPLIKELYIYRCYDFKGGLRWVSGDKDDIRAISP